ATTEIYPLPLHDALPICPRPFVPRPTSSAAPVCRVDGQTTAGTLSRRSSDNDAQIVAKDWSKRLSHTGRLSVPSGAFSKTVQPCPTLLRVEPNARRGSPSLAAGRFV